MISLLFSTSLCWINLYIFIEIILKGSLSVKLGCSLYKNSTSRICISYFAREIAQRHCGLPIPAGVQGKTGWVSEQPGLVKCVPAHSRGVGITGSLSHLKTKPSCDSVFFWVQSMTCKIHFWAFCFCSHELLWTLWHKGKRLILVISSWKAFKILTHAAELNSLYFPKRRQAIPLQLLQMRAPDCIDQEQVETTF